MNRGLFLAEQPILKLSQFVQQEKTDLIVFFVRKGPGETLGQACISSHGVKALSGGRHTKGRKGHAPPVMSCTFPDDDPQGVIDPRRQRKGIVMPDIEGFPAEGDHGSLVHPDSCQGIVGNGLNFGKVFPEVGSCSIDISDAAKVTLDAGKDCIPYLELDILVCLSIGIGHHMEADQAVIQLLTVGKKSQAAAKKDNTNAEQQSSENFIHKNTVHTEILPVWTDFAKIMRYYRKILHCSCRGG